MYTKLDKTNSKVLKGKLQESLLLAEHPVEIRNFAGCLRFNLF